MKYANIIAGEEVMTMEFLEKMNLCEKAGWEHANRPGDILWLCQHSYGKWPFIVDFPMKNGDFP